MSSINHGHTHCPKCGCVNDLPRPLENLKDHPVYDECKCWFCERKYKHSDVQLIPLTTDKSRV